MTKKLFKLNTFIALFTLFFFALTPGIGFGQSLTFNSSSSWTVPCGVTSVTVQAWGAGGGGAGDGSNTTTSGGGGGGGGYSTATISGLVPGTIIACTIGAGGVAGAGNANGGLGGTTTFSTVSAPGGAGGLFAGGGGGGGIGTGGTGVAGSAGVAVGAGGVGGAGATGGGAGGLSGGVGNNGLNGTQPGGGGSGGDDEGGSTRNGGVGGAGRIIISWTGPNAGTDQTLSACATTTTLAANSPAGAGSIGTWTCVSGCTGVTITTPTSPTSTVTGLVPGTNTVLQWTWTGGGAGCTSSNDQVQINTTQGVGCWVYCSGTAPNSTVGDYISNVTFGSINNTTAGSSFTTYSSPCSAVTIGSTYPLCVTVFCSGTEYLTAVFDWNNDGDFSDAGESFSLGSTNVDGTVLCANITIPPGAMLGNTKMRILQSWNAAAASPYCQVNTYGEIENYCVTILGCTTTIPAAGPDQSLASCDSDYTFAANAVAVGETGLWIVTTGSGTFSDPTSPTATVTNLGPGVNTFTWTITDPNVSCPVLQDVINITTTNLPTTSLAGPDAETCNTSIALTANAAGVGETGTWSVLPVGPTFTNANSPTTNINGMAASTAYTLTWTISNGTCASADNVIITRIAAVTPAAAGADQTGGCTNTAVNLTGNNPANGNGVWSGTSGIIAHPTSTATEVNALTVAGTYTFTYTVSAPGCVSSVDQMTVTLTFCDPDVDVITCPGGVSFTDPGGAGNYANNTHYVQKYCPSDPSQYISVTFTSVGMADVQDHIIVLNGADYTAPIIDDFVSMGTISGGPTITSSASDGCLTFIFQTGTTNVSSGWAATVNCTATPSATNVTDCSVNNCLGGCLRTICSLDDVVTFNGDGVGAQEINEATNGCLTGGERCSNWFIINPESGGTLSMDMFVNSGQDQDYALWEAYAPNLECPAMTGDAPIRCNFAGSTADGTGFNTVLDASNPAYESSLTITPSMVAAGVYYIILVNTFNNGGACPNPVVDIDFGGDVGLSCDAPIPLGLEVINLSGMEDGKSNLVVWQTMNENNIAYYTLEKSSNLQDWSLVGTTYSGRSSEGGTYSMHDNQPSNPFTYYRVKQTDLNGTEEYTNIISVSRGALDNNWISNLIPNPATDEFSFQYQGKNFSEPVTVTIVNAMGQILHSEMHEIQNKAAVTIDTYSLANGTYVVQIVQGDKKMNKRLSILK